MCLMRLKYRKIFITILLVVEIMLVNLTYQSFLHREINKEENKITKKQFAMYIKENDEYVEYEGDNLFPKGYYVNKILSKCVDEKNNPIETEISSLGGSVTITSNKTVYCTLYFDKNEMLEYLRSKDTNGVLSEDIVGDMYRYQGVSEEYATDDLKVVDNNYICLGEDCSEYSEDLYRIIGVTETGELKVIKKTVLSKSWFWTNNTYTDVKWPDSYIYHGLNDDSDSFYNSLDSKLQEKITNHKWMYGDAIGHEYDGDLFYKIESGNTPTRYYIKTEDGYELSNYTWNKNTDYVMAKVGLQYTHDYLYAYPGGKPGSAKNASKSWIFLMNNDDSPLSTTERLMTRYGCGGPEGVNSPYLVKDIYGSSTYFGDISGNACNRNMSLRPVFYLTNELSLIGEGTLTEPFEIDYEKTGVDIINSKPTSLSNEEVGGMHRFQGTNADVNNNYLCLGEECAEYGDNLYRIIGITNDGKIKVIKKKSLNGVSRWTSDATQDIKWPDSEIFKMLNIGDSSYYNTLNENYRDNIIDYKWTFVDTTVEIYNGDSMYAIENAQNGDNYVNAKIGLQYLYDYLYAYTNGNPENMDNAKNSWIFWLNNERPEDKVEETKYRDLTMTRVGTCGSNYCTKYIYPTGFIGGGGELNAWRSARPVFYLSSETLLKGNGSLKYPYVIVN